MFKRYQIPSLVQLVLIERTSSVVGTSSAQSSARKKLVEFYSIMSMSSFEAAGTAGASPLVGALIVEPESFSPPPK